MTEAYSYSERGTTSDKSKHKAADNAEASDWLMEATVDLSQDLETSKKELEIIRFIIQEMEQRSRTDHPQPSPARGGRLEMMKACREYSSSRCDLLRERLRQVQFWAHTSMLGQQVPDKAPDEWRLADVAWRRWLSEQASSHVDKPGGGARASSFDQCLDTTLDASSDVAWSVWGVLPYILSADIWFGR
ncbi:hypothetical protein F5B22DRAFT_647050 [Xylaria bambusicola]|uniref:uncharacterized protein n=1 Tax=Xylaria bambusicola TaxID=326684 RepID=UPI00200898B3|nr:uncharacterized protein F5B22DRAFT_647050 [Xylaria bambusicola]KAI0515170.1 hypothetical protein F5B22DRAFT_647050 [Xylaria bambusicola]